VIYEYKDKKWGNSLALRIPSELAKDVGLVEETDVNIRVDKGHIIITPIVKITLEELLAQVTDENIHDEVDFGESIGNEMW
jgi:antitoxin MazE